MAAESSNAKQEPAPATPAGPVVTCPACKVRVRAPQITRCTKLRCPKCSAVLLLDPFSTEPRVLPSRPEPAATPAPAAPLAAGPDQSGPTSAGGEAVAQPVPVGPTSDRPPDVVAGGAGGAGRDSGLHDDSAPHANASTTREFHIRGTSAAPPGIGRDPRLSEIARRVLSDLQLLGYLIVGHAKRAASTALGTSRGEHDVPERTRLRVAALAAAVLVGIIGYGLRAPVNQPAKPSPWQAAPPQVASAGGSAVDHRARAARSVAQKSDAGTLASSSSSSHPPSFSALPVVATVDTAPAEHGISTVPGAPDALDVAIAKADAEQKDREWKLLKAYRDAEEDETQQRIMKELKVDPRVTLEVVYAEGTAKYEGMRVLWKGDIRSFDGDEAILLLGPNGDGSCFYASQVPSKTIKNFAKGLRDLGAMQADLRSLARMNPSGGLDDRSRDAQASDMRMARRRYVLGVLRGVTKIRSEEGDWIEIPKLKYLTSVSPFYR